MKLKIANDQEDPLKIVENYYCNMPYDRLVTFSLAARKQNSMDKVGIENTREWQ